MSQLVDVLRRAPLHIQFLAGRSETLVVSFAGVGTQRSVTPPPEFFKIAGNQGENPVLFISDISRSWLNAPKMADTLRYVIEWTKAKTGARRVVAIGNSMGGSMALLMADLVAFDTVTALVPQVSAHPDIVPEEKRWMHFRRRIVSWPFVRINRLSAPGTQYFIVHGGSEDELVHACRFPEIENGAHYILPDEGHNLARSLQNSGDLPGLMFHAMEGHQRRVHRRMTGLGAQLISDVNAMPLRKVS